MKQSSRPSQTMLNNSYRDKLFIPVICFLLFALRRHYGKIYVKACKKPFMRLVNTTWFEIREYFMITGLHTQPLKSLISSKATTRIRCHATVVKHGRCSIL